jgi:hypothetical protein
MTHVEEWVMQPGEARVQAPQWAISDAADVAYCLLITTSNPTDNRPTIRLVGTHGTSLAMLLTVYGDSSDANKGSSAAVTAGRRCFWLEGARVGNIGLPYAIDLSAGGEDGWTFDRIDLLLFTKRPEASWKTLRGVLPHGKDTSVDLIAEPWMDRFADVLTATPEHVTFRHRRCLASKKMNSGSDTYVPRITITADKWGNWEDADWLTEVVMIESEITVTDNRWSTEPIPRTVEYSEAVSSEAVRRALTVRERSTTTTRGITIGVERYGEASVSAPVQGAEVGAKTGWKASAEYKFSRVSTSLDRTEQEESTTAKRARGEVHTLRYEVPAGCVTFFSVARRAQIKRLPADFHGAEIVRTDDGLVETVVERHDFRMNAESGTLQEYGPVYSTAGEPMNRWGLSIADYPQFERALTKM